MNDNLPQKKTKSKTDLRLLSSYSQQSEATKRHPQSISQLSSLINLKRSHNVQPTAQQVESTWVNGQGANLGPLKARLKLIKQERAQPQAIRAEDNYFYIDLEQNTVEQYLVKAEEYASLNLMQSIMSQGGRRRQCTLKLMDQVTSQSTVYFGFECPSSPQRRDSYISITAQVVQGQQEASSISHALAKQFKNRFATAQHNSLWEIVWHQLGAYSHSCDAATNLTQMLISSLKLIHQEFARKIHGKDIERYVNNEYLHKMESRVDKRAGTLWPQIWVAYCAGESHRVQSLIASDSQRDHRDLSRLYSLSEQQLLSGRPKRHAYSPRYEAEDVFYQQFIFNITGQARAASKELAQPLSLELVLLAVRTLGVFYSTERDKYEELRANIVRRYSQFGPEADLVRHMLYLLDYTSIAKMGANALMSREDYLHFLLVVAGYPGLINDCSFARLLTKQLSSFITELLIEGRKEYVHYIQLLPDQAQVHETSRIVAAVDGLDTFDWPLLRTLIDQRRFNRIVCASVEEYRSKQGSELKAAVKLVELCEEYPKAYDSLVSVCINYHLNRRKYSREDMLKAEELAQEWGSQSPPVYQLLAEFMVSVRELHALIVQRRAERLRQFVASCEFLALKLDRPNDLYEKMFRILNENRGVELYYYFLRLALKAAQIYAAGDQDALDNIKAGIRRQLAHIRRLPFLREELEDAQLKALKEETTEYILDML